MRPDDNALRLHFAPVLWRLPLKSKNSRAVLTDKKKRCCEAARGGGPIIMPHKGRFLTAEPTQ